MGQIASRKVTVESLKAVASYLEQQAEELRQELDAVESDLLNLRSAIGTVDRTDDSVFQRRGRPGTVDAEVTDAIRAVLMEEQPMHRKELMRRVEEGGVHIGGKKPLDTFAAYLTKDPRFASVGAGNWGLVE